MSKKMRVLTVLTLLGMPLPVAVAQTPTRDAHTTPATTTADAIAIVPFTLQNGRILFDAEFDGIRGTYVFDTGAPATVLNARYLQARKKAVAFPSLDTVPTADRTNPVHDSRVRETQLSLITLQHVKLGTLVQALAPTDVGPPQPWIESNAVLLADSRFDEFDRPVFGSFGLNAMEPFEVVIDYPTQHLIFIRLDSAGRPFAKVPGYAVAGHVSLVPVPPENTWWGVMAELGSDAVKEVVVLDAGGAFNFLPQETMQRLGAHLAASTTMLPSGVQVPQYLLDHLTIGGKTVDHVDIRPLQDKLLGAPFLAQLGVVGFNFRTRQFLWYR
jgi:hypothetical protein